MTISANALNQITGSIPRSPLVQKDLEFLKAIPAERMSDGSLENTTIDLLVGSDYFWHIIGNDKVTLPSGTFLIPSKFGYIVTGKFPDNKQCLCNLVHTLFVTEVGKVTHDLENLWRLETIGITEQGDEQETIPFQFEEIKNDNNAVRFYTEFPSLSFVLHFWEMLYLTCLIRSSIKEGHISCHPSMNFF